MKPIVVCFFSILFFGQTGYTQELTNLLHLKNLPVNYSIAPTQDPQIGIPNILSHEWQQKFKEPSSVGKVWPENYYWLRIDFKDQDLSLVKDWSLSLGFFDEIRFYYPTNDSIGFRETGALISGNTKDWTQRIKFRADDLFQGRYIYVRIRHVQNIKGFPETLFYDAQDTYYPYKDLFSWQYIKYHIPVLMCIGAIIIMILYSSGFYFLYRDKILLRYSFFLLCLLLYIGRKVVPLDPLIDYPKFDYVFNEVIQVVVNIAYLYFVINFLQAKKYYPKLYKISYYVIYFLFFFIAVEVIVLNLNIYSPLQLYLINFERLFMTCFAFGGITYILINLKNPVALFIVVGTACFIIGSLLTLFNTDFRYMLGGAIIETFIFALGLGYRFNNIRAQKAKMEREIDKIRLTALKVQMNPHFIFNSLNSIRSYIIRNETTKASQYLTKFSKLIRLILQYSSEDYISLQKEISNLKLYIELEQMRFRESFGFNIEISVDLDVERVKIPPLILQPYIENAIWHGLTPKKGDKKLDLILEVEGKSILCTIRDNGVGRSFSVNRPADSFKKPMALELTSSRINLISKNPSKKNNIIINDIVSNGKPAGTEVKLVLPLIYDAA